MALELDHINPVSKGGESEPDNLALACSHCNSAKSAYVSGFDPATGEEITLFHPRFNRWNDHFQWNYNATLLIGLTAIGRATIARLNMNRSNIVEARRLWASVGWHPPRD